MARLRNVVITQDGQSRTVGWARIERGNVVETSDGATYTIDAEDAYCLVPVYQKSLFELLLQYVLVQLAWYGVVLWTGRLAAPFLVEIGTPYAVFVVLLVVAWGFGSLLISCWRDDLKIEVSSREWSLRAAGRDSAVRDFANRIRARRLDG